MLKKQRVANSRIGWLSVLAVLILGFLAGNANADEDAPAVAVSIKPIHSLVAGVMGSIGTPQLIVTGTASPHTYQLRVSEARILRDADLVVWVGPDMETFLRRPIEILGTSAEVLALHEAAEIRLLPFREGGIWEHEDDMDAHEDDHDAQEDDHDAQEDDHDAQEDDHDAQEDDHAHSTFDMHIWLDPDNARNIVKAVAESLVRIDPVRADSYRNNAQAMQQRMEDEVSKIRERLAPVQNRSFVVFHDGYRYFEEAFGLSGVGAIAVDPARRPGARRLAEIRHALSERNVACVFSEPQFEPGLVQTIIEGTNVRTAALDPLGAEFEAGPDAWFATMNDLANSFAECLADR